jgi:hypothetical protein
VLLSSQFQGFCRDLHSESVDHLLRHNSQQGGIPPQILRVNLTWQRKLDHGNPNPGNIGSDFGRLGLGFWSEVNAHDQRTGNRMGRLEDLNTWRNAIAHQDFSRVSQSLHLNDVRYWRRACNGLSRSFDRVLASHISSIVGRRPW